MLENKNWKQNTYLNFQNKKEFNFLSNKSNNMPLLPISGNVFTYLLLNKLTQIQVKNSINSGNNEYFLAKSVNIQKEKNMNNLRLDLFLNQNNVNKTEIVNYTKIGYNKFSIYNIFSLMKKDRFFLNEKFYQDILGKRAYNVYKNGIFGYEKNLKILKKYNEYFERQIYLMSEKVDTFLGKNTAFSSKNHRLGKISIGRYDSETTPLMGWKQTTGTRAYLEIWRRLDNKKIKSIRPNAEKFYLDEKNILNVEDLSLMALKNLRDYELYFGMIFYKKEINKYLSKAGVGRGMHLSVFSRNATRFNFLKDAGYKRTSSNYRTGVATKYGLLRALYTKKHFPRNSLDFENPYTSYSFFNTENSIKFNADTTANAGKFNRRKQPKELVKVLALRKNKQTLLTHSGAAFFKVKKFNKNNKLNLKINKNKKNKLMLVLNAKSKTNNKFFKKISIKNVYFKKSNLKSKVLFNLDLKLNIVQLRTLLVSTLFKSLTNLNLNKIFLLKMKKATNWRKYAVKFMGFSRKRWKTGVSNSSYDPLMQSRLYTLHRMKITAKLPENGENAVSYKNKISQVLVGNKKVFFKKTQLAPKNLRYISRNQFFKKRKIRGLLNLKAFTAKRERLVLKTFAKSKNISIPESMSIKTINQLNTIYANLKKNKIIVKKRFIEQMPNILKKAKKLNKELHQFRVVKTKCLMESFFVLNNKTPKVIKKKISRFRIKKMLQKYDYITLKYRRYRLAKIFKEGLSTKVFNKKNVRRPKLMGKRKLKRIVTGTLRGKQRMSRYVGNKSNIDVSVDAFKPYRNKIGKTFVIYGLGLTYKGAKKHKLNINKKEGFNLKFKFVKKQQLSTENTISGAVNEVFKFKKNKKQNTISNYSEPMIIEVLKKTKSTKLTQQIKNLRLKNINLIKKYLGLSFYNPTIHASKLFRLNYTDYYSMKKKYEYNTFEDVKKAIKKKRRELELKKNKKKQIQLDSDFAWASGLKALMGRRKLFLKINKRYKRFFKIRNLNLDLLNKKLGLSENTLDLLTVHNHGFTLEDHYNYQKYYLSNANRFDNHFFKNGNNPKIMSTVVLNGKVDVPNEISKEINPELINSEIISLSELRENSYNTMKSILDSKIHSLRINTKRKTFFINNLESYCGVSNKKLTRRERRDMGEFSLGTTWWLTKKIKNPFKIWEYDFSDILNNTMRRLGKFSKKKENFLRIKCWRRFNFLNKSSIEGESIRERVILAKKKSFKNRMLSQKKIKFTSTIRDYAPIRLSGVERVKRMMPAPAFLTDLEAQKRNALILSRGIEMNDVENESYASSLFVFKQMHAFFFKRNFALQQKIRVFGENGMQNARNLPYEDRSVKAKYTRSLYNQFARRKFPTFWYRISRKKYPLKSQKKEWGIKIPLAERFIFPFDNQVWNTTYDSSVVYYNNIGWLNFTKNLRRFKNLSYFYRYGREHDELLTAVPFTTPTGYFEQRCTDEEYENYMYPTGKNLSIFRHEFGEMAYKNKNPLNKAEVSAYFTEYGTSTLRTFNYKFMAFRDTLKIWHAKMKPLLGFFGLKTYYTYNSYLMKLNTEVKTRRYRALFSNFAFAFKLNKTDFTRNIIQFNFTDFARTVFAGYRVKVFGDLVRKVIMFKNAFAWVARTFTTKYKYFKYSATLKLADNFDGKQLGESLVKTNSDYFSNDYCLVSNPIIYAKNNSTFVETYSKFRYRNKILKSSQNLQLRFIDEEARRGFQTFSAKNLVW